MSKPGITPAPGRRPKQRKISMKSAVHHISGKEQPYPVYDFGQRIFVEKPHHEPFK